MQCSWRRWRGQRCSRRRSALLLSIGIAAVASSLAWSRSCAAAEDNEDAERHVLRGTLVDAAGRAVADTDVWLVTSGITVTAAEALSSARTDKNGRFEVTVPGRWFQMPAGFRQELGLAARGKVGGLATLAYDRHSRMPADGVRLTLPPALRTTIKVLSSDGQPVAKARVVVDVAAGPQLMAGLSEDEARSYQGAVSTPEGLVIREGLVPLPEELRGRFTADTANDGTVDFAGIAPEQNSRVRVESSQFGTQLVMYMGFMKYPRAKMTWPAEIRLAPVGTLRGRLAGDKPEWLRRRKLIVSTMDLTGRPEDVVKAAGLAEVTTDDAGRFEIPALAPGHLRFVSVVDPVTRSCLALPQEQVEAGKTREIELQVVPAVRVRGVVVEADDGKPLPGVGLLAIGGFADVQSLRADAKGAFAVDLPPGQAMIAPLIPRSMTTTDENTRGGALIDVPHGGRAEFAAPPVQLRRGATLRGVTLDDDGKPVAGVRVAVSWSGYEHRTGQVGPQELDALTDERGQFAITITSTQSDVRLRAATPSACTNGTTSLPTVPREPLTLTVSPRFMSRLRGRVSDSEGKAVADLPLELWSRPRLPFPPANGTAREGPGPPRRVELAGAQVLRTGANGLFITPPLDSALEYRVLLRAPGYADVVGEWVKPASSEIRSLGELSARRLGGLQGVVHDRQGRTVAGAIVILSEPAGRSETKTDESGAFRLASVADSGSFLFVRKDGFRFHGQRLSAGNAGEVEVVIASLDEAPPTGFLPVPLADSLEDRRSRALELLKVPLTKPRDDSERMRALETLATFDPDAAIAHLERRPFDQRMMGDQVRRAAVQELAHDDAEAAVNVVEAMQAGMGRVIGLTALCGMLPKSERQRQLDLLEAALAQAREVKQHQFRLGALAMVARRLFDLAETERAEKLLRDDLDEARKLGLADFPGYTRGTFAEALGIVDLPAALELIRDLKDPRTFTRHHGNLAHQLSGRRPEEAERVLNLVKPPQPGQFNDRDQYAVRVCYRMATVDLPRAEKIAASIEDLNQRGYALGVMATALASREPETARRLLRAAYDVLDEADRRKAPPPAPFRAATIAGALLSVAERLDGDDERRPLLQEGIWRTVALVPPPTNDFDKTFWAVETGSIAAMWLAEYDAALAREVLLRVDSSTAAQNSRVYVPALSLVASDRLNDFIDGLPDDNSRDRARNAAAATLPLSGAALHRRIHHVAGLWPIDAEDLFW